MFKTRRFYIIVVVAALLVLGFFSIRIIAVKYGINKAKRIANQKNLKLKVEDFSFTGLFSVQINNILVSKENEADTAFYVSECHGSFSLSLLIKQRIPVNNIRFKTGYLNLLKIHDQLKNEEAANDSKNSDQNTLIKKQSIYHSVVTDVNQLLNYISELNIQINNFKVVSGTDKVMETLLIKDAIVNNGEIKINFLNENSNEPNLVFVHGLVNQQNPQLRFTIKSQLNKPLKVPLLNHLYGLYISTGYSESVVSFSSDHESGLELNIQAKMMSPSLYHWRIGADTVSFDSIKVSLNVNIDDDQISSVDKSYIVINKLPVYLRGAWFASSDSISIESGFDQIEANDFFNSLPDGMFESLENIDVTGKIGYNFKFNININIPDSLTFDSAPETIGFEIKNKNTFLQPDIKKDFVFKAGETDHVYRNIYVTDTSYYFTPLSKISPLLIYSVLTAEDGTFFFHKGFNHNALRQSIATNIKERRFARGGSTITMQLVKNVYLNRNKNIARKAEEAILVWLIENQKLISKERMLEVYLNIIEWGPGIYGITEASEFYFEKHPSDLSLEESIYLSAIIPRPKYFKYAFDKTGKLRSYLYNYFDVVSGRLLEKGIITEQDTATLKYEVNLKNRSLKYILPDAPNLIDTVLSPEDLISIPQ